MIISLNVNTGSLTTGTDTTFIHDGHINDDDDANDTTSVTGLSRAGDKHHDIRSYTLLPARYDGDNRSIVISMHHSSI